MKQLQLIFISFQKIIQIMNNFDYRTKEKKSANYNQDNNSWNISLTTLKSNASHPNKKPL